jgi:iron complex outermembrane receptor protein
VTFRATVENLLDKSYWAGSFNDNFATTGGPRTVRVSATVDF